MCVNTQHVWENHIRRLRPGGVQRFVPDLTLNEIKASFQPGSSDPRLQVALLRNCLSWKVGGTAVTQPRSSEL